MRAKEFGSGYFGEWFTDEFGLPAYRYTCNQLIDEKALTITNPEWRNNREHLHEVGNDRIIGVASNFGYIQLRQDEGAPKFLNDYNPEKKQYGGGLGYLVSDGQFLSSFYGGNVQERNFERVFGIGYYQKKVSNADFNVDQIIFAPFGDVPLLISQVTVKNISSEEKSARWIEYWGTQPYQFSFKAYIQSSFSKKHPNFHRREFAEKFTQHAALYKNLGIIIRYKFTGYSRKEKRKWNTMKFLANTLGKKITGGKVKEVVKESHFDDESPPTTFLISLSENVDSYSVETDKFFGNDGPESPEHIFNSLSSQLDSVTPKGILIEKNITLKPNEEKTLYFGFGYGYSDAEIEELIKNYQSSPENILKSSSEKWKQQRIQLTIPGEPWVDRELIWHNYYLRGNFTYDSFFKEHILSQGHVYQYLIGFQGASRDPLQHILPFIYTNPTYTKEVLRYTMKTVFPNGEIPYGICGCGVVMPSPFLPSDLELWLLWVTSEYILANRDLEFLEEVIPLYPVYGRKAKHLKVKDILALCYHHFVTETGIGRHGLQRISNGDWNDMVVHGYVKMDKKVKEIQKHGESVLNAAMAIYTLDIFKTMLEYSGDLQFADGVEKYAENQRIAVSQQWTGQWLRRAWLSEEYGWIGEKMLWLEPQPWAILGNAIKEENVSDLIDNINIKLRNPSKIGAMVCNAADEKKAEPKGSGTNAGIWPSINGTLIMAFSKINGNLAWEEWKKNTLATHAECYPHIWYGIWSGPDTYNSELSKVPGGTGFTDPHDKNRSQDAVSQLTPVNWTDFPVMNMHPHAWPLYNVTSLLNVQYNTDSLVLKADVPFEEFSFESPLLGYKKSKNSISGWYCPLVDGTWKIRIELGNTELEQYSTVSIGGKINTVFIVNGGIEFSIQSSQNSPKIWTLQ